jgi:hypothetical protein
LKAKIFAMDEVMRTHEKRSTMGLGEKTTTGSSSSEVSTSMFNIPGVVFGGVETKNQTYRPNSSYQREEEKDIISADLELTLAAMHDSLVSNAPSLLPLFRKLSNELHQERSYSIQQRAKLLDQVLKQGSSSSSSSSSSQIRNNSSSSSNVVNYRTKSPSFKEKRVRIKEEKNTITTVPSR